MLYRIAFLLVAFCSGIAFGQVELSGNNSNKLLWVRAVTNMAPGAAFYLTSDEISVVTATYGNPNQPYIQASLELLTRKFDTNGSIDRLRGNLVTLSDGGLVKQPVRIDDEYETARILGDVHSRWVLRFNGRTTPIPTRFIATRRNTLFAVGITGASVGVGDESFMELDGNGRNSRIAKIGGFPPMQFEGPPAGFAADGSAVIFADIVNGVARKDSFYLADTKSLTLGRLFSWDPRWQRFIWPNTSGRSPVVSTPDDKLVVSIVRDPGGSRTTGGLAVIDTKNQSSRIIELPFGPQIVTGMAVGRDRFVYCSLSDRSHSSGPNFQGGIAKVNLETGNVELIGIVTNSVEVPPIITKAGVLLVSSLGTLRSGTGTIHAIQTGSVGGLAKSPWPRSTGDNFDSFREQAIDDSDEIGVPDTIPSPHVAILVPPQSLSAAVGDGITLNVIATNATSFQWIKDGIVLKDATNSTLVINNASDSDSGQYRVIASVGAAPFVQYPLLSNLMAKDLFALRYWVQNVSFYEGNNSQDSRYFVPRSLGSDGRIVGEYQDNRINRGQAAVTGPNGVGLVKLEKLLGGQRSVATSINDHNQIAGSVISVIQAQGFFESFILNEDWLSFGKIKDQNFPMSFFDPSAINDSGSVVGQLVRAFPSTNSRESPRPFIFDLQESAIRLLGGLRDDSEGNAVSINNMGQVVGWSRIQPRDEQRAFITGTNGLGMRDLGVLGGSLIQGSNSVATAVNNLGQVVGGSSLNGGDLHAFITEPNGGKMRGLGTLGGISSHAYDINDSGQVVGWSYTNLVSSPVSHAFVTGENGSGIFDLNSFVQLEGGGQLVTAYSINNKGQILADGGGQSYLLTPTTVISQIATITVDCPYQDLQKGLIAYYPLDGNSEDKSGNGRFGVVNGPKPAQDRFGNLDGSLSFNGKTDYVLINKKFPDLIGLSFSAWVFYEGGSSLGRGDIFSDSTIDGGNDFQIAVISGNRIGVVANKNGSKLAREIELPYSIKSKWTHIVWAMSGVEQTVYINGLKISTLNEGGQNVGFHSQATIGVSNSEDPLISFFQGRIDEVRVYDRQLSECEVQSLYAFESEMPNKLNRAPTLNALADVKLLQNAPSQTVNLSGIGSGAVDEVQVLTVTATSDNPGLIPNPAVTYTSPNTVGSLSYQPVTGATGKATITVTVKDDGGVLNGGQDTFSRQFTVTVSPINHAPTLNGLDDVKLFENAADQTVNLSGIGSGAVDEVQALAVTATSDNPGLIPNPRVTYISPNAAGTLSYQPIAGVTGKATITVTVKDDGGVLNGGQDTFSRQFTVTVSPLNRAPTLNALADVKLLQNGPSQTVNLSGIGSGAVDEVQALTVTATSDNPGLIASPSVAYTSPNEVGSLSYQPIAGATGKATITVTVKDDGGVLNGGQDTFSRQFLVDVTRVDNKAPEVQIVSPQDGSITTVDSPISLVAEANDSDGTISKVEFFQTNNQLIGTAASNPYQVTVNNLSEGKYTFYAKATDNSGLSSVSTPVSISVVGERRDVAVIKVSLDPKLDILTQYISEVQLSGQQESLTWKTFERSDISFEVLARYRVVVWNDPHPASKISNNEIGLLKRLLQSGVTVYSIGPKLATAADGLDAADKTDWRSIVNLNAIGKAAEMGQVELIGEEDHGPILDGMYGTVEAFKTFGTVDGATATASADSSGKSAGCDVYVSFPSVSLPDSALARRFSQLIPLAENGDEFSIEERKKVFKNAICWLLDCNRCAVINLTLLTEETLIEPAVPQAGEQFVLKLQFTQNAECPATGVRVKVEAPPGLTVLGATTEQGEVSHGATEANFSLGRLGVHKVVPVELKLRSEIGGIVTNNITFYANGLTSTSIVAFHHETVYTISGDSVPMISADRDVTGNVRLKVGGQLGATYVIEKSVAIAGNGQIQWAALKEFQLVVSEYVHVHVIDATTSSAMFRVRKR
jgi:probable HAF family extracellular repeat protein